MVTVPISGAAYQKVRRSARQCASPPTRPSARNAAARRDWSIGCSALASRIHCQRKYSAHIPACAVKGACRSSSDGFAYCTRLMLSASRLAVSSLNVHDSSNPFVHAVGSPSLIGGKCAARMGSMANGVTPSASAPRQATTSRLRSTNAGRLTSTATATAGAASSPAMWFA